MGCHFLLQGTFLTQGSNLCLLSLVHWQEVQAWVSYHLGTKNKGGVTNVERTSLVAQMVNRLPTMRETWVQSLSREGPLEKEMTTHSSTLAWKIL